MSSLRPVSGSTEEVLGLLRAWEAAPDPEPLTIATSGSTGRPKNVVLSRDALRASARATHARLGGPGRWVLNLPATYVAGVQVLFRSLVAGVEPVVHDGDWERTVERLGEGAAYASLVPTQLVRLLRDDGGWPQVEALARLDAVLLGGGPLDPRVRAEAEERGVRVVQTYGMSETCGGCVYDGVPLDGVEVRIEHGEVQLRGAVLFEGYEDDPARTAEVLTGDGWFRTDDLGELVDGRLRVLGRADDVILSGGVNVPAQAVATAVAADAAAVEVVVVGVPDDEWGEAVTAVVEARDPITLAGVRDLVEPRAWAPRHLVVVPELPRLSNGKPDRVAVRALAQQEVAARG